MPERKPELLAPIFAEASGTTATLRIYGPVDPDGAPWGVSATEFGEALASLPDDTGTINLHIHSRGGDVFDALAIVQQLRDHPAKVNATVDSLAASAASVIAVAADSLAMAPDASLMIHDARVSFFLATLTAADAAMYQTRLVHASDTIAGIYARKAGGTTEDWRAAMDPESWYNADEAVAAGLADSKLAAKPAEAKIAAALDLSPFKYAGRNAAPAPFMPAVRATQTPAEPPVVPTPTPEEADAMSDTLKQGLRERFGCAEDASDDDILAAIDADSAAHEKAIEDLEAKATAVTTEVPDGKKLVSQSYLDALSARVEAGEKALARQDREDRDAAILQAQIDGKIGRDEKTVASWHRDWERDSEAAKAELASLPPRFPVGPTQGYSGDDGSPGGDAVFSEGEAEAVASHFGVPKEALLS